MSCYETIDPGFRDYIVPIARLEKLHTGMRWAEGPVYFADGRYLLVSDIPNDRILKWEEATGEISTFRSPSNMANGNTRDRQGRLVTCEHGARRVTRTEYDGSITVLADSFEGKRLNSPNDVVVRSDGTVWFTDPPYGIMSDYMGVAGANEIGACNVYRFDPADGSLAIAAGDFDKPNGLAFSADGSRLFVADSGRSHGADKPNHIRCFDVDAAGRLSGDRVFAEVNPGFPDGFRLDVHGNVWTSAHDGVHCLRSDGTLLGKILTPEGVANLCFGGPRFNRLFITAETSLYAVYLNTTGVPPC